MANGKTCNCGREHWVVIHYQHNHSAFESPKNGFHHSQYSVVQCRKCGNAFSTKAKYVEVLPRVKNGCLFLEEEEE